MATLAKITVRVRNARGHSTVDVTGTGRNVSLLVADVRGRLLDQQIFTTSGSQAFWADVLAVVQSAVTAGDLGGT